ncbi:MAG: hypothetical protein U9Q06_04720, partial [Nanoarchaeota archaeon]|nr:hypothetical protein [Nanoarchaeota archaeon]
MIQEIFDKVVEKKEFSQLPKEDVELAFKTFEKSQISDEEKVKKTRNLLRQIYSGFGSKKLMNWKNKSADEVLKKHLSTRERYNYYEEIYSRLLNGLEKYSVVDLGAGVNGFSYNFFKGEVDYLGVEAVGQFVTLTNDFFKKKRIKGLAVHLSLFDKKKVINLIKKMKTPRIVFMFKVIDSLEKLERNYTLEFLRELKTVDIKKIVVSFATESWFKRKKFFAKRNW